MIFFFLEIPKEFTSMKIPPNLPAKPTQSGIKPAEKLKNSIWFARQFEVKVSSVVLSIKRFGLPAKGTCRHKK